MVGCGEKGEGSMKTTRAEPALEPEEPLVPHRRGGRLAERAALSVALVALACRCGRREWRVVSTQGCVRYLRCAVCGRTSKVSLRRGPSLHPL